mgnify:CR=1 FL=1
MSKGLNILHSHSGLERELRFPKHIVLVDATFASVFHRYGMNTVPFKHRNVEYVKVAILDFIKVGGVFKNLDY